MDLHPTFGHQELLETISQGGGGSSSNSKSSATTSGDNDNSNSLYQQRTGVVADDDAVRRLGYRLSLQAHGEQVPPTTGANTARNRTGALTPSSNSGFELYVSTETAKVPGGDDPMSVQAKQPQNQCGYPRHHGDSSCTQVLRRLTIECRERFRSWAPFTSRSTLSVNQMQLHATAEKHADGDGIAGAASHFRSKGLLSAVLEGHSDTTVSSRQHNNDGSVSSRSHSQSQSISTKDSRSNTTVSQLTSPPARGQCLTSPSEAVYNNDNADGNLICYENDSIVVPRKHMRVLSGRARSAEFRIIRATGQGTFAQVFECLHVQTGETVALKIIKNKAAYTRQAAIEIDIFATLQKETNDTMVNLLSYFMHQEHLCLVFELLGLNLYEVLKKRQFRGLPLACVREIIQQAVHGVRDLAARNVVHCDIKPENILLVSEAMNRHVLLMDERQQRPSFSSQRQQQEPPKAPPASCTAASNSSSPATSSSSRAQSSDGSGAVTVQTGNANPAVCKIKLIDFGSACFEGYTAHTYIQSRFYRSPEVLLAVPYDSSIDMWSIGCVAAELYLGLPILPGVHEHDQVGRIEEMIGKTPDWMIEQGSKAKKYFLKYVPRPGSAASDNRSPSPGTSSTNTNPALSPAPPLPMWRIKTQKEYVAGLSQSEIRRRGGLERLNKPPGNRYFRRTKLKDILNLHAQKIPEEKDLVSAFVHFLYGVLDPDPWKRYTATQASNHPFVTGDLSKLQRKDPARVLDPKKENQANLLLDLYWEAPWDTQICRRKLLNVQKMREQQESLRKNGRMSNKGGTFMDSASSTASDRRRARLGESVTSVHVTQWKDADTTTPRPYSLGSSPPNRLSTSGSTTASAQVENGATINLSASWTGQGGHPGVESSQFGSAISEVPPVQSFQGVPGYTPIGTEVDFAQALQRPGVIPSTYGLGTSMTSMSTSASYQQIGSFQSASQYMSGSQFAHGAGTHTVQQTPSTAASTGSFGQQPSSLFTAQNINLTHSSVPNQESFPAQPSTRYQEYASSSVTSGMSDAGTSNINPQFAPYQHQQQMAVLQEQQLGMLQQQQVLQQANTPQQHAIPFQQRQAMPMMVQQQPQQQQVNVPPQQQQFAMPQQQMMLASAPGGGYYVVTTSATGQPLILQPVSVLNQQQQVGQPMMQQQTFSQQFVLPAEQLQQQQQQQHQIRQPRSHSSHYRRGGTSM